MSVIKIWLLQRVTGHLSHILKFSAGQIENLPDLSDISAEVVKKSVYMKSEVLELTTNDRIIVKFSYFSQTLLPKGWSSMNVINCHLNKLIFFWACWDWGEWLLSSIWSFSGHAGTEVSDSYPQSDLFLDMLWLRWAIVALNLIFLWTCWDSGDQLLPSVWSFCGHAGA